MNSHPMKTIRPLKESQRVYCAGPLFSEAERREMLEIARHLKQAKLEPFVPHVDGMEFMGIRSVLAEQGHAPEHASAWVHEAIFALDVYQVVLGCGSMVCNLNGRVPDEGAVSEAAMAWTLGKPVVLYKDDVRSNVEGRDNPLVAGLAGFVTIGEMDQLAVALADAIARNEAGPDWEVPCPPQLAAPLKAGERLWEELCAMGPTRTEDAVAELVLELFGRERSLSVSIRSA